MQGEIDGILDLIVAWRSTHLRCVGVCRPPHCHFAAGPREEVIRISLSRLQVRCSASVSLLKLVGFEVLGQVLLVVPRKTDLVLLLRWNRTIDGSVQESTSWHVDDLDPDHPTTIDLLKCRPNCSRDRDKTTDVQRRDHTHDVGQVDDDHPILDPTRDHRISQSILQCVHHCAHCPLPVLGDGAQALQTEHQARSALVVPAVPIDEATLQVLLNIRLGEGQAPDALLRACLQHLNGLGHVKLACLQHPESMLLHVLREVTRIASDAPLRQQAVHLAQGLVLCRGQWCVQEDLPRARAHVEDFGLRRLEQRDLGRKQE
mmetsp:Transcript_125333/g.400684  ORF Transcript_125333/g.400684 Transcript_125333/m.400684 type:complete len:317 (+) Transcript_125333:833-1783(+)